ncbi:MAG: hypothetical protein ACP5FH_06390 [Terracidiphilus sp.]
MRLIFGKFPLFFAPALLALAGCGGGVGMGVHPQGAISVTPGSVSIDTNCSGCNAAGAGKAPTEQFTARFAAGGAAQVSWSLSGGDAVSGPGSINASGQYTPPGYLTADRAAVVVTATLEANPGIRASTVLTVTPGFLRPLTPENVALGARGSVTITGFLAEAGGTAGIHFELSDSPAGQTGSGMVSGVLSAARCQRGGRSFTSCTVTYTAPALVATTGVTYVVATVEGPSAGAISSPESRISAAVLVNSAGVNSNAAEHQEPLAQSMALGGSGGNNLDYDTRGDQIVDCCSGTLGALVADAGKRTYVLSNNHVLARSDQASAGDLIVQPGLIDNNCTPFGSQSDSASAASIAPVAFLTGWLPLNSKQTNADAAIAQAAARAVDPGGSILELGARQPDGTLGAAPPGTSSSGGRGEAATLGLQVAKSGRTTGLTCGAIVAVDLDVEVDYFRDCAESQPYLTKTFTRQFGISGNQYSDSGDSGALVVDAADAEPVGLLFAGGNDTAGVSQAVANPAADVLRELGAQLGGGPYTFVGGADHAVSCLNYGDSTISAAQARVLSDTETSRAEQALSQARMLINPAAGILGVAIGKSNDHPGEAAVILYTDQNRTVSTPDTVDGVRTLVIPATAGAVAAGSAPQTPFGSGVASLDGSTLARAEAVKDETAAGLMSQNPAFFGVGVGQSLDNPKEAALVIYVDRALLPAQLPALVDGLRTRYIVMSRLHVTRSYAVPFAPRFHCRSHARAIQPQSVKGASAGFSGLPLPWK